MWVDEELRHYRSKMGLNVFFVHKKGYRRQHAIFATKYGSIDNDFYIPDNNHINHMPAGIAHFLEHKLFEDPKKDIFDFYSSLGSDVNAFTGFDQTAYVFTSVNNFYESFKELIKFVQNPYFTEENVEKEKGIISQEIKMYEDDPSWRVYFNCLKAMYQKHPINIDIAGTIDSINEITHEMLYNIYNIFYHPKNMGIFIAGDLDFEEVIKIVEDVERKDYNLDWKLKRKFSEPKEISEKYIEDYMDISNPIFYIGFKDGDLGYTGYEEVKKELVSDILLDMLFGSSSDFYNELYEGEIINDNFGSYYTGKTTYGHSLIMGEVDNPNLVYEKILNHIKKPWEEVLDEDSFKRIVNNSVGNYIMGFNNIEFISTQLMEAYFLDFDIREYLDLLRSLSFQDIINRYESHLSEDNMVLSVIRPKIKKNE